MKMNFSLYRSLVLRANYATLAALLLFMLSFVSAHGLDKDEVLYKIEKSSDGNSVIIKTEFIGNKSGNTEVYIPTALDVNSIDLVSMSGRISSKATGATVPCTELHSSNKCTISSLTHEPSDQIRLTYA